MTVLPTAVGGAVFEAQEGDVQHMLTTIKPKTKTLILYLCLPVAMFVFTVFVPLVTALVYSFFEWKGGPGTASMVMAMYGYQVSFSQSNMGYGSCISVAIFVLSLLVIGCSQALIKYLTREKEA